MKRYDPTAGRLEPIAPMVPASGSGPIPARGQPTSEQASADGVGAVVAGGTQDGILAVYNTLLQAMNLTNTDKGSSAVATHTALADPHPQYHTAAEVASNIATHSAAVDPHGDRAFATTAVSNHVALSDPHTQYLPKAGGTMTGALVVPTVDSTGDNTRIRTARTPATATATGLPGQICWDATHLYVCVATNTWRRIAHSTW
jgi:hypothetical protein